METRLIIELIRAKMINAKREKEACEGSKLGGAFDHFEGQEIAFKQLLDILEAK